MIKATLPMSVLQTDQEVQPLALYALMAGVQPDRDGTNITYDIEEEFFTLDHAKLIVSKGGEVSSFPLFIEIDDVTSAVDASLPDSTFTNEDGEEVVNTWSSWMLFNHSVLECGGRFFVETDSHTGSDLPFSQLLGVVDSLILPSDLPKEDIDTEV